MTPRARPLPPDVRRQAIVDAVIPLLVREGPDITTRQIAEAAGIAEGTIFRAFPDKAALIRAAATSAMAPPEAGRRLPEVDPGLDLHGMVRVVAAAMLEGHQRVVAVLMALRRLGECPHPGERGAGHPDGPPAFVREAQEALIEALSELFARYRDQLSVEPHKAALVLRALVFGSRHLGIPGEQELSVDDIATVVVDGVTHRDAPATKRARKGRA